MGTGCHRRPSLGSLRTGAHPRWRGLLPTYHGAKFPNLPLKNATLQLRFQKSFFSGFSGKPRTVFAPISADFVEGRNQTDFFCFVEEILLIVAISRAPAFGLDWIK